MSDIHELHDWADGNMATDFSMKDVDGLKTLIRQTVDKGNEIFSSIIDDINDAGLFRVMYPSQNES